MKMNQLQAINDILTNGYIGEWLDVISIFAIFFGGAVMNTKNPIVSLMCLIALFASISVYLILIGFTFIGLAYIVVYVGAVTILFLFVIMLIDIRTSELHINDWNSVPLALLAMILLNCILFRSLSYYITIINNSNRKISNFILGLKDSHVNQDVTIAKVMYVSSNNWDGDMTEVSQLSTLGSMVYTSYNIWLFIVSIILLLAMTGAIIITIKPDRSQREISSIGRTFVLHTKCWRFKSFIAQRFLNLMGKVYSW
uniref:NADH-ubiquinone oxidoreductase chain 6 n=1 Tax=Ophiocordycipitaceae sp. TaxID=1907519 RepID=A0A6M8PTL9_9HYPO|nr:NADH dehydrogenase subunit 6 [Ophiocordycipitaceae sp.]QKG63771.1 NADH dehydrogenase subunit 6 [Ophiocordycipitaceae sp.]